ncbi:MAG: CIA30 family protein [Fibrobacteraceae bacterium]|nr:CIA30 family protein [Fibrobacteraceae bacterium]
MKHPFTKVFSVCGIISLLGIISCGDDSSSTKTLEDSSSSVLEAFSSSGATGDSLSSSSTEASSSSIAEISSSGKGALIDNFEDGDNESLIGTYWYAYNDSKNGGASTYTTPLDTAGQIATTAAGYNSTKAFSINYKLNKGTYEYDPYIGWGVTVDLENTGRFGGITYYYIGGAHTIQIETSDVEDYDNYLKSIPAARTWTKATIRFQDLAQSGWGKAVAFNAAHITAISFQAKGDGKTDSLILDNLYLMDSSEVEKDPIVNDLTINDPVIPSVTIGDITISNPLQAKAMKYLNKGINFTNWLENADGKFDGFTYGETDIKLFSDNGIKALRLPIDLDLYADNRDAFVADTTGATALDIDTTTLFTVLDSFAVWTERHGLSFTIDYHEYDGSYNKTSSADTRYQAMMAIMWKTVAAHFASNPREDLFFELLNEPGIANGNIAQANWTITAQGMIDSIRTVDNIHTILFGDVEWYDISYLKKRTPFTDDNIIYVFHSYDPFVFTHQSASWTEAATIKNLPFPYDTSRWSTQSAYFGVKSNTASWVKTAIKNYYKTGNKEYILQTWLTAKEWAVTNNVPVICNEFGAYNGASTAQDRLNYLKAVREVSDTLQIPISHWGYTGGFSLFENGKMIEGIKEALDL